MTLIGENNLVDTELQAQVLVHSRRTDRTGVRLRGPILRPLVVRWAGRILKDSFIGWAATEGV
jgi:hypothetical protein